MKKCILVVVCLTVLASGGFALDKTIGGGLMYNAGFTNWDWDLNNSPLGDTWEFEMSRNGFGLFAFFGVSQFFELNLGLLFKNPDTMKVTITYDDGTKESGSFSASDLGLDGAAALQLGIYFKIPIPISTALVFFPTVGTDLELTLDEDWWSDFWLRAGVGLDIFLSERMFLRGHAIYGIALPFGSDIFDDANTVFGHGLLIKFGIGWML